MHEMKPTMATCFLLILLIYCQRIFSQPFDHKPSISDTNRSRIFSPRMDYDEWTPLGRGDPLKNDPTFDYVPPVLDRVQYWLDSQSSTEASAKRDILVLGVTAKKTSPKIPEHFLKFIDGPKFSRQDESNPFRKDFIGSTGAEPPKLIRTTKFRTGTLDHRSQNRIQSVPASYYPSPYYNEKAKPYTMMMPPPMVQPENHHQHQQFNLQTEEAPTGLLQPVSRPTEHSTSSSVTFDKSNLIYQSSQTFDPWLSSQSTSSIVWSGNDHPPADHFDDDYHTAASANHEVVVGQNANIIVEEDSDENEQVVLGRKESLPPTNMSSLNYKNVEVPGMPEVSEMPEIPKVPEVLEPQKMHIVLANTSSEVSGMPEKVTVSVVMPTNYLGGSNSSKTEKETTKIVSTTPLTTIKDSWRQPTRFPGPTRVFSRRPGLPGMPMNVIRPVPKVPIQEMMMMMHTQGPFVDSPAVQRAPPPPVAVPKGPGPFETVQRLPGTSQDLAGPTMVQGMFGKGAKSPLAAALNSEEIERVTTNSPSTEFVTVPTSSTTSEAPMITSASGFTTDPIFKHYKQPTMPIYGPMYLIIQGHSKVKTYKPSVNKHGVPLEKNSIEELTTSRPMSKFEQFVNENTRVVSTTSRTVVENEDEVKAKEKRVGQDSLLSLVESGLSAFTAPPLSSSSLSSSSSSSSSGSLSLFERFDDDLYDELFMDNN